MTTYDVDPDRTQAVDAAVLLDDTQALPASSPDRGWLAGRYSLQGLVGRGGVGDVHRAQDTLLQRPVAVKVLRERSVDDADLDRFRAEARTLAGLSHPGLVTVLDAGETEGRSFLVMELVEGTTLAGVLADGPLEADAAARLLARVAEALAYAHDRGVVHRDVKPGNVLVADDGRVKLADFGIARLIGDTAHHTRTGTTVGTVAYLAPEQVTGGEVTQAVDVYALGLVVLEAVTGEKTYTGPAVEAALARLSRSPVAPAHLPARLRRLVAAMTATDPARRPTARAVAEELARVAEGHPGPARPRRPRLLLAAAAAVLALAVGAGSGLLGGGTPSEADRAPAGTPAPASTPADGAGTGVAPQRAASSGDRAGVVRTTAERRRGADRPSRDRAERRPGAGAAPSATAPGKAKGAGKGRAKGGSKGSGKGKGRR